MTLDNADQSCSNQLVLNLKPQHDDARERGRRRERESERAQEGWARGASALSQHQDQRSVGRSVVESTGRTDQEEAGKSADLLWKTDDKLQPLLLLITLLSIT